MAEKEVKRSKLTITTEPKETPVGEKQIPKLSFKARNEEGKELAYFTFTHSLFEFIQKDAEIDADIETSSREVDGNTYTDRKVTQVYKDGAPVASKQQQGGGGWRGKSPEDLRLERRSIEGQTALKEVGEWLRAGTLEDQELKGLYEQALKLKLRAFIGETPPETDQPKKPPSAKPKAEAKESGTKPLWQELGKLLQEGMGYSRADVTT